ncbi:MAG TPA: hypothetical protein VL866_01560 [Pyrinomonadaceae bacterium]|nr:hypothetical protein [Pyrinomonadaceae bacterium]
MGKLQYNYDFPILKAVVLALEYGLKLMKLRPSEWWRPKSIQYPDTPG